MGRGSIPDFFQVLNVSYSGSSMVYFGPTFSRGGGGEDGSGCIANYHYGDVAKSIALSAKGLASVFG